MTDNHTELCERLDLHLLNLAAHNSSLNLEDDVANARNTIEFLAFCLQQQAARIAELEKERDALKNDAEHWQLIRHRTVTILEDEEGIMQITVVPDAVPESGILDEVIEDWRQRYTVLQT